MKNIALFTVLLSFLIFYVGCKEETDVAPVDYTQQLDSVDVVLDTLSDQLVTPWGMEFVNDGILITDKSGELFFWKDGSLTTVTGTPQFRRIGQGGLLDVCKHPDFESNNIIYLCGSAGSSNSNLSTTLYRAELAGTSLSNVEEIFTADPKNSSGRHFGARIVFDNEGFLYLSFGDRGAMETSQELSNHNGTVIRINDDGSVPSDNPFLSDNTAEPEIWTYGHRNIQGMAVHPETGEIWTHEHGPRGGDEINVLTKGANYGWPLASFGIDYDGDIITTDTFVEGTELPVYYWDPSIAPCGMTFYNSDSIPQWKGSLFLGALVAEHINHLTLNGNRVANESRLLQGMARFRDVKEGPDGYLYLLTERPGLLMRLRPKRG